MDKSIVSPFLTHGVYTHVNVLYVISSDIMSFYIISSINICESNIMVTSLCMSRRYHQNRKHIKHLLYT